MLSQTKKLSKIKNYWLNDFDFRRMLQNLQEERDCLLLYKDAWCSDSAFFEFKRGLTDKNFYLNEKLTDYKIRKIYYEFGRKLGLKGQIARFLQTKDWMNTIINESLYIEANTELKEFNHFFTIGCFFAGLEGKMFSSDYFTLAGTLAHRAGYDIFLAKRNKK